jgi:uncharacterized protein (TIGR02647 family)
MSSSYTPELVAELEILVLFNLGNTMEGLKIHHTAAPAAIAAATRLYEKELTTQADGGYLTSLGLEARAIVADHPDGGRNCLRDRRLISPVQAPTAPATGVARRSR